MDYVHILFLKHTFSKHSEINAQVNASEIIALIRNCNTKYIYTVESFEKNLLVWSKIMNIRKFL